MKRIFLLAGFFIGGIYFANAQSCAQILRLARSTYEQGRLHELPDLLQKCLNATGANGFTPAEKVEAYKLLTLSYIYLEEPEKADESMLTLLRFNPYFEPNKEIDPAEFQALYKTFRTRPIYRLGVRLGSNMTTPAVSNYNPVGDGDSKYSHKFGFNGGITFEIPLTEDEKFTLNPELNFVIKSFGSQFSYKQTQSVYSVTTGSETMNWLSLPVVVQYKLAEKKYNPYVLAGVSADYLLGSKISVDQKREKNQSIELRTFDADIQREKLNVSAVVGAGLKTRLANGFFVAEVRYNYGLSNINSASTILANQALLFDYGYSDGLFKLNSLYATVGYVQNFFNPKKKKVK